MNLWHNLPLASSDTGPQWRNLGGAYCNDPVSYILDQIPIMQATGVKRLIIQNDRGLVFRRDPSGAIERLANTWAGGQQSITARIECKRDGFDTLCDDIRIARAWRTLQYEVGLETLAFYPGFIARPPPDNNFSPFMNLTALEKLTDVVIPLMQCGANFLIIDAAQWFPEDSAEFANLRWLDGMFPQPCWIEGRPNVDCPHLASRGSLTVSAVMPPDKYDDPAWLPRAQLTGPRVVLDNTSTTTQQKVDRARSDIAAGFDPCCAWWDTETTGVVRGLVSA